ncbi:MAG TPA: sigma-70 family RNA polymerase sigma factor [Ktedonobacteraceae bacterium]|nr:sigma-70 family RNA polymerase sigma factor [Ktedonobacteraceae bacterium]
MDASLISAQRPVTEQRFVTLAREIRLARSLEEVPTSAYHRLIEGHLFIVNALSKQYHSTMYEREDLEQEGCLKLVDLVHKYAYTNENYGRFVAYLKASIRGHLFSLVCSDGTRNVYQSTKYPVYLEPLFDHDRIITLPVQRDESMFAQYVEMLLNELPVLQQSVLRLRYGVGCEQVERHKDIARILGVTEAKVRYAEAKAMIILRSEVVA